VKKQELMSLCSDENDIRDCDLCPYEFTDTCMLRLEKIKKELEKIRKDEKKWKKMKEMK